MTEKDCQLGQLQRNMKCLTPPSRKGLQGWSQAWHPAVEGAKATPTYFQKMCKVNSFKTHYLLTFSYIFI